MIEIADEDVPPDFARFTLKEFAQGMQEGLFDRKRGDAMVEWFTPTPTADLAGRKWLWRDSAWVIEGDHDFDGVRVFILWWGKTEKMN